MDNAHKLAAQHNARAKKLGAEGTFTAEEWIALCEQYGNACLRCGERGSLSVDHVIALCVGGSNFITNIQPLCLSCNFRKTMNVDYRYETKEKRLQRWKYIEQVKVKTQGRGHSLTFSVKLTGHLHDEISLYLIDQGVDPTPRAIQDFIYPMVKRDLEEQVRKLRYSQ